MGLRLYNSTSYYLKVTNRDYREAQILRPDNKSEHEYQNFVAAEMCRDSMLVSIHGRTNYIKSHSTEAGWSLYFVSVYVDGEWVDVSNVGQIYNNRSDRGGVFADIYVMDSNVRPYVEKAIKNKTEAEEARQRQAEEARRKQAEEARKRQTEAEQARKREEEFKRQAEEARRKQAEEARKRQAEAEEARKREVANNTAEAKRLKDLFALCPKTGCQKEIGQLNSLLEQIKCASTAVRQLMDGGNEQRLLIEVKNRIKKIEQALNMQTKLSNIQQTYCLEEFKKLSTLKEELERMADDAREGFPDRGAKLFSDLNTRIVPLEKALYIAKESNNLLDKLPTYHDLTTIDTGISELFNYITKIKNLDKNVKNSFPEGEFQKLILKLKKQSIILNYFGYVTSMISLSVKLNTIDIYDFSDNNEIIDKLREKIGKYADSIKILIQEGNSQNLLHEVSDRFNYLQEAIDFNNKLVGITSKDELKLLSQDITKKLESIEIKSQGLLANIMRELKVGVQSKISKESEKSEKFYRETAEHVRKALLDENQARNDSFNRRYNLLQKEFNDLEGHYSVLKHEAENLAKKLENNESLSISLQSLCLERYEAAQGAWISLQKSNDENERIQLALEIAANCKILLEYDKKKNFHATISKIHNQLQEFDNGSYSEYAKFIFNDNKCVIFKGPVPKEGFTTQPQNQDTEDKRTQQQFQHASFKP